MEFIMGDVKLSIWFFVIAFVALGVAIYALIRGWNEPLYLFYLFPILILIVLSTTCISYSYDINYISVNESSNELTVCYNIDEIRKIEAFDVYEIEYTDGDTKLTTNYEKNKWKLELPDDVINEIEEVIMNNGSKSWSFNE